MLKGENIIVFSCADWKTGPSTPQHISANFARNNKVLFIETFGSRYPTLLERIHIERIGERLKGWFKRVRKKAVKEGQLYIYSPLIPLPNARPFLFINTLIFLNIMRHLIKKLNMKNPVLFFYIPPPMGVIGKLGEKAVIYYSTDDWTTFPVGRNKLFMDSERDLVKKADLVLAANEALYNMWKPYAHRIARMYHGVDYGHFVKEFSKDTLLPEDIKDIPKPVIAFVGCFAWWIDLDLIKFIAEKHKEWSIVSIGMVETDTRRLEGAGNIYILGKKNYAELPNYYRAIDVFIIPFTLNEHTNTCAPTRLYEHLSSGKPLVTTDFMAAREIEKNLISVASDKEDFVNKIEAALKEKEPSLIARRKDVAKKNTWELKVEEISNLLDEALREKKVQNAT